MKMLFQRVDQDGSGSSLVIRELLSLRIYTACFFLDDVAQYISNICSHENTNFEGELDFWKRKKKEWSIYLPGLGSSFKACLLTINEVIRLLKQKMTSNTVQPFNKIKWYGSPSEFVMTFHKAIANKQLVHNDSSDTEHIVHELLKYFSILKKNKSGYLTSSSVLSYFKKANCGDLYS